MDLDHSSCPRQVFACGCITGCIIQKYIDKCPLHNHNFGPDYMLVQFPCGCIVSERNGNTHGFNKITAWRSIEMMCLDHFSNYTTDKATLADLYISRNDAFHSQKSFPCYAGEPKLNVIWVWNHTLNRAVYAYPDDDDDDEAANEEENQNAKEPVHENPPAQVYNFRINPDEVEFLSDDDDNNDDQQPLLPINGPINPDNVDFLSDDDEED